MDEILACGSYRRRNYFNLPVQKEQGINISNRTDGSKIRHARLSERKMNADEGIFEPKRKHKSARLSGAVWAIKCLLLGKQS